MNVSVYIPCYNVATTLPLCIEGLLRQTHKPDEIIVVDDGSRDNTLTLACKYPVKIVRHQFNRGLAAARNTGLAAAQNDLVGCLDADVVPHEQWLEQLLAYMKFPNIAIAAGKMMETVDKGIADRWRTTHMVQHFGDELKKNPTFIYGNNSILRKAATLEVGGYSERFRTNAEDVEFSLRIRARGYDTIYDPKAAVFHLRHDTISSILTTGWRWNCYAFDSPVTLKNNVKAFFKQHVKHAWHLLGKDWRARRFKMMAMDVAYVFSCVYLDLKMWCRVNLLNRSAY